MKKRMISLLLTLIMVFSFVATMNVTAFAEDALIISDYATLETVAKGQTLIGICKKLNINYDEVKNGIKVANDFRSDTQLSSLYVGEKIWIPTSKANSNAIVKSAYAYDSNGKAIGRSTGGGVTSVEVDIASSDVISYTVKKGDTIGKICKANNLEYDAVKEAIVKLNPKRFTTIASLGKIQPNWVIYLPASDGTAKGIVKQIETAEKDISGGGASSSIAGDTLWGYVVKHTMARGETIKSVCNALGKSYSTETSNMVKTMNNIKDLSRVNAGTTYWFPATYSNGTGYAIYSHTVVAGDTCGNLCSARGVAYNNVQKILQGLNPGTNLNNIKRGQTLLIVGGKAGEGGNGGVNVVVGGSYNVTCNAAANGKVTASAAKANYGDTVTITATPNTNYKTASVTVTNTSTKTAITLTAAGANKWTFKMPAASVTVAGTFTNSGALRNLKDTTPSTDGSIKFKVNGVEGTTAYAGDTITVVATPKSNLKGFKEAQYSYTLNGTGYTGTVSASNPTFTMVDSDVSMKASFNDLVTVSWNNPAAASGTVELSQNGTKLSNGSKVTKNSNVLVVVTPKVDGETGTPSFASGTGTINADSKANTWIVSPFDNIVLDFTFTKVTTGVELKTSCPNGSITLMSNGNPISIYKPGSGATVVATPKANTNFSMVGDIGMSTSTTGFSSVKNGDGTWSLTNGSITAAKMKANGDGTYTISDITSDIADLTVNATFNATYDIKTAVSGNISISEITVDGKAAATAGQNSLVRFKAVANNSYELANLYIKNDSGAVLLSATHDTGDYYKFTMPAANATIAFETYKLTCVSNNTVSEKYTMAMSVNGVAVSSGADIKFGDNIRIDITAPNKIGEVANTITNHPVVTPSGQLSRTASSDTNNQYYVYEGKVNSNSLEINMTGCWS